MKTDINTVALLLSTTFCTVIAFLAAGVSGEPVGPERATSSEAPPPPLSDASKVVVKPCRGCNIVLVTFDTLRADHLGAFGYERNTSPHLDAFSETSYVFSDAISQSGTTIPSLSSIMTSRFPVSDKILEYGERFGLDKSQITLPRILSANGYATVAVIGHEFAGTSHLRPHFDSAIKVGDSLPTAEEAVDVAASVLPTLKEPFFFWLHIRQPHAPYEGDVASIQAFHQGQDGAPLTREQAEGVIAKYTREARRATAQHYAETESLESVRAWGRLYDLSPTMLYEMQVLYDANIVSADRAFGRFLEILRDSFSPQKTIVLVASDHGESMGAHKRFDHNHVWQGILHTPILLRMPSLEHRIFEHSVMNVDIFPTLLTMVGLADKVPEGIRGLNLFRKNRKNYVQYAEYSSRRAIKSGAHKLLLMDGKKYLFNLEMDPWEQRDLAQLQTRRVKELLRSARRITKEPISKEDPILDQLREIGYIE